MLSPVITNGIVNLPAGVKLKLLDNQAYVRGKFLKPVGKLIYETLDTIQFKAGESFEVDIGKLPKSFRTKMDIQKAA